MMHLTPRLSNRKNSRSPLVPFSPPSRFLPLRLSHHHLSQSPFPLLLPFFPLPRLSFLLFFSSAIFLIHLPLYLTLLPLLSSYSLIRSSPPSLHRSILPLFSPTIFSFFLLTPLFLSVFIFHPPRSPPHVPLAPLFLSLSLLLHALFIFLYLLSAPGYFSQLPFCCRFSSLHLLLSSSPPPPAPLSSLPLCISFPLSFIFLPFCFLSLSLPCSSPPPL